MSGENVNPITQLLQQASAGDDAARGQLLERVYDQLRAIARERMAYERRDHTLQATALVHEAYIRLLPSTVQEDSPGAWQDRGHFYRAAAEAMRRILVDHARKRGAQKRGGERQRLPMNVCDLAADDNAVEILALDQAILRFQEEDPKAAEVMRLRFFAGLSVEQTALATGLSERTVKREWAFARAKLFRLLEESSDHQ